MDVVVLCLQLCVSRQPDSCIIGWLVTVAALAIAALLWAQHAARLLGVSTGKGRRAQQPALDCCQQKTRTTYRLNAQKHDGRRFRGWHVRAAPSSHAEPVAQLKDGDEVEVVDVHVGAGRAQGDWLLLADGRGWVRKEHDGAAWCRVDENGELVTDRWSTLPPSNSGPPFPVRTPSSSGPPSDAQATAAGPSAAGRVPVEEDSEVRAGVHGLDSAGKEQAAPVPPRPPPAFTNCFNMESVARQAADYAPEFLADSSWEATPSPVSSAVTWRMPSSPVLRSPIRPFKATGVVKGVDPGTLATMFLGLALKWPERQHKVKKRKQEVRRVEHVNWSTTLWFEHEKIPVPFVADRECLYLETFVHHEPCDDGREDGDEESFMIVRKSVEKEDIPVVPGRVRGLSYVVMTFRHDPAGHGTEQTLAMDFDIKGRVPGRAVDGFLAQQAALFDKLSKFVRSKVRLT